MHTAHEQVDWQNLKHAAGAAADIPDLLAGLRSRSVTVRHLARYELYDLLRQPERRFEATPPAVAKLIAFVENRAVPDRAQLLRLISNLAIGYHTPYLLNGFDLESLRHELGHRNDWPWFEASYAAAREGVAAYVHLLSDPEPGVRSSAAFVLAWFREHSRYSAKFLRRALAREGFSEAKSSMVLALGLLDAYDRSDVDISLFRGLMADSDQLIGTAAAISLMRVELPVSARVVQRVLASTFYPELVNGRSADFHWNRGDVSGMARQMLCAVGTKEHPAQQH